MVAVTDGPVGQRRPVGSAPCPAPVGPLHVVRLGRARARSASRRGGDPHPARRSRRIPGPRPRRPRARPSPPAPGPGGRGRRRGVSGAAGDEVERVLDPVVSQRGRDPHAVGGDAWHVGSSAPCRTTRTTSSTGCGRRAAGRPGCCPPRTTTPSASRGRCRPAAARRLRPVPRSPGGKAETHPASTTWLPSWRRCRGPACAADSRTTARRWRKATSRRSSSSSGRPSASGRASAPSASPGTGPSSPFARAALGAVPEGTVMRWVVDDDVAECPDCDDNALAGPVPSGEAFPTGHPHPPAHAGCRCLLAPANA